MFILPLLSRIGVDKPELRLCFLKQLSERRRLGSAEGGRRCESVGGHFSPEEMNRRC